MFYAPKKVWTIQLSKFFIIIGSIWSLLRITGTTYYTYIKCIYTSIILVYLHYEDKLTPIFKSISESVYSQSNEYVFIFTKCYFIPIQKCNFLNYLSHYCKQWWYQRENAEWILDWKLRKKINIQLIHL